VWPAKPAHCLVWWLVDLGVYNTAAMILAWTSIERHILVFHDRWLQARSKRLILHYLPLVSLMTYATVYYTVVLFFPPCQHTYTYTLPVCAASPCHLLHPVLGMWEMGVHGCLPAIVIAVSSIGLIARVLLSKRRANQLVRWRKYQKMIVQLLSVSLLYLALGLPIMVISVARLCGLPADEGVREQQETLSITYWVMLLLPIVLLWYHSKFR
jgi:hypothetical protein